MAATDYIFYYTGVLTWVFVWSLFVMCVIYYFIEFWKHCLIHCLLNLKFYVFGVNNEWKGKCYEIWIKRYYGKYGLQKHHHSMKYFKRLAYKRFISEIIKERKSLTNK